jgi:CheY-like chemotaxis protein
MKEAIDILLVEDNDDDVYMIMSVFEESKLLNVTYHVEDGEQALSYLRKEGEFSTFKTPELILLDINMPIKGGFDVLEELKEDNSLKHIPIIILTTSSRKEDIVKSYGLGASSYIKKPLDFLHFYEVLQGFEVYWSVVSEIPKDNIL